MLNQLPCRRTQHPLRLLTVWLILFSTLSLNQASATSADNPTLALTPDNVSCTTTMTARGTGFAPGSEVVISPGGIDAIPGTVFEAFIGPVSVADDGTFTVDFEPAIFIYDCFGGPLGRDGGSYELTASTVTGESDPNAGNAFGPPFATAEFAFAVDPGDPLLTLTPDHAFGCIEVTAHGENFEPGSYVTLHVKPLRSDNLGPAVEGHPLVEADGTFTVALDPRFTPFIECDGEDLPPDGARYLVGAITGRNKPYDDPWRDPQAAAVFTVTLPPEERFQQTWARTDAPVASEEVNRTWIWGPEPFTGLLQEEYTESPDGARSVQYYDKSRMEIAHPTGDRADPWYVTNGLLVVEMIEGKFQAGDNEWHDAAPAEVPIAGDAGSTSPTYAEINRLGLMEKPAREPGTVIDEYIYTSQPEVFTHEGYVHYGITSAQHVAETDHAIASVFWEFMTSEGIVSAGEYTYEASLFESPFYATGFPITEAYWTTTLVGGQAADVLWQCFERRCLTYTPANDPGWQVEASNVGRHYYAWRYGDIRSQVSWDTRLTLEDSGQAFAYVVTGRFEVVLDGRQYRQEDLALSCAPANSVGSISNLPSLSDPNLWAVRYQGVTPGECSITNDDFNVTVRILPLPG